ncbi:hypothetical protein D3C84_1172880 [compost metagenome]
MRFQQLLAVTGAATFKPNSFAVAAKSLSAASISNLVANVNTLSEVASEGSIFCAIVAKRIPSCLSVTLIM